MKILVILSRIPFPLEKGDKLRAYYQLKELHKRHEICLCCLSDEEPHPDALTELSAITSHVHFIRLNKMKIYLQLFLTWFGNKPFQVAYFYQRRAHKTIRKYIQEFQPDHIYCQLVRTAEYARHEHNIPKTLDFQDAFSKGMARRATSESNFFKRIFFRTESRRLLHYEHLIFELFENKCIISQQDRALIFHPRQKEIAVIPNGVDLDFFKPQPAIKTYDLCFIGNMGYAPNIQSSLFLVKEVMPLLLNRMPHLRLLISGATPAESIRKLAGNNVTVAGWTEDIRTSYAQSKLFIAPMQIGTGLQNKLLEAMSMKIPCITSPLANDALGAVHGKHIVVARKPAEYADAVISLLENPETAMAMAERAHQFVSENFSWEKSTDKLEQLMSGNG